MKLASDGPLAIPLWIGGHPYLTVTERFFDISPAGAAVLRRVPLCGPEELEAALAAAATAQGGWSALSVGARREHLLALAEALEAYADHFAGLLRDEAGFSAPAAAAEVGATLEALRAGRVGDAGMAALVADDARPLASLAEQVAPVLLAGGVVVAASALPSPGAAYALCELSGRAGWPGGVLNLMHGDAAVAGLFAQAAAEGRLVFENRADAGAER